MGVVCRLEYKYSRLVLNAAAKESELPAPDSCAIMEGEDGEDELIFTSKKSLLGKIRCLATKVGVGTGAGGSYRDGGVPWGRPDGWDCPNGWKCVTGLTQGMEVSRGGDVDPRDGGCPRRSSKGWRWRSPTGLTQGTEESQGLGCPVRLGRPP